MRMHKRRTMPAAAVRGRPLERRVRHHRIGAVHFLKMKVGKPETNREMLPPAVCTSTGTEIAYPLSCTQKITGSIRFDAVFSASQTRLRWSYRRRAIHT